MGVSGDLGVSGVLGDSGVLGALGLSGGDDGCAGSGAGAGAGTGACASNGPPDGSCAQSTLVADTAGSATTATVEIAPTHRYKLVILRMAFDTDERPA